MNSVELKMRRSISCSFSEGCAMASEHSRRPDHSVLANRFRLIMPFSRKDKPARGSAADGGVRPSKCSGSGFASHCTEIDGKNTARKLLRRGRPKGGLDCVVGGLGLVGGIEFKRCACAAKAAGLARPIQVCDILQLDTSTLSRNVERMRAH